MKLQELIVYLNQTNTLQILHGQLKYKFPVEGLVKHQESMIGYRFVNANEKS